MGCLLLSPALNIYNIDFLVNIFPALSYVPDWFPGTGWKHTVREWREYKAEATNAPFEWTKAQVVRTEF
jgi:hypothetical protein